MTNSLVDQHQSYWQLACIQISSIGLPGIMVGGELTKTYGAGTVFLSILIGNLIIWIMGLLIISMAARERSNAIENVRNYLGKYGSRIATLILVIAFLSWYLLQLKAGASSIQSLLSHFSRWKNFFNIRFGVFLGMLIALLSTGGIRMIKWICIGAFPLLLIFPFYACFISSTPIRYQGTWGISFTAVVIIIAQNLVATINLPTFFRHSRSRADSFLALIIMTLFFSLFPIIGIHTLISTPSDFYFDPMNPNYIFLTLAVIFIISSTICVNLVNIYFSSAGWEKIFPHRWNPKEYAIVGLFGTSAYAFLQTYSPMQLMEDISANCISSMGIVLLLAFLIKSLAKHRPRHQEKIVSGACWLTGCITALIVELDHREDPTLALLSGISATIIAFLIILFLEETIWSLRQLKFINHLFRKSTQGNIGKG